MKRKLKPADKPIKRPYATHYYSDAHSSIADFSSQGAASTDHGAVRATVVRIFMGQWAKAVIQDRRDGTTVYTITLGAQGLKIHYGAAVGGAPKLRRVA